MNRLPSAHSEQLRAIATKYAPSLMAAGARAVAVTGSGGRGDADASSDLDLWVVADREDYFSDAVENVPVTVMRVAESRVYDLDVISGVEVAFLHVVADPDAIFERVLARFAEHSDEIRAINIALAVERLEDLLANEHGCSPQGRLWTLRACAHLACALRIYRDTDLLMPKMRHFAELLPRDTYQRLREIQGIDDVMPSVPDLLEHTRSIAPRMTAQLRALPRRPTPIATPRNALLKLAEGSIDDGVLLLRAFFERSFIDQVVAALPDISIVQFLLETCDPNIRTYWQALHGLAGSNDMVARTAEATSRSVHALVNELETELASAATC